MSIEFNCFDGNDCISQSLSIANTGVNTSKLYRMEQFVESFPKEEAHLTGEEIHKRLDEIEKIHALYSPAKLGLAAALACCAFTFLLGGGPVEMILAFIAAGIGNVIRTKLIKHHFTLFLNIAVSISAACLMYAICLKAAEIFFHVPAVHEAGYICSMLFIIQMCIRDSSSSILVGMYSNQCIIFQKISIHKYLHAACFIVEYSKRRYRTRLQSHFLS